MPGTASNESGGGNVRRPAFLRDASELGLTLEQAAALADRYFPMPPSVTVHGGQGSAGAPPETDGARLARMGTDGVVWARELAAALNGAGYSDGTADIDPTPGGLLHVWVVNAIEAGRSAGYSQGAAEAAEHAREQGEGLAADLEHEGWADMAVAVRHRLAGGAPLNDRDSGLPANPAGSELAADSAGSALAANPAGSEARARRAWREALERIAATVAPSDTDGTGGWAAPYVRVATP
jgi:hypothetical protein